MRSWALAIVGIAAIALCAAQPAAATAAEETPFCEAAPLPALGPVEELPSLPEAPPPFRKRGFGPENVVILQDPPLAVGGGKVGYRLGLRRQQFPAHARWEVVATLSRVDRSGNEIELVDQIRRRLPWITQHSANKFEFKLGAKPGLYRVILRIDNAAGNKLASYGSYYRVVAGVAKPVLVLEAPSYRPGQVLQARIENLGRSQLTFGVEYGIERFNGSAWELAPESPRGPIILIAYLLRPGWSSDCLQFTLPAAMPPGQYRMTKTVTAEASTFPGFQAEPATANTLTAEFQVSP